MANETAHRVGAAVAVGGLVLASEKDQPDTSAMLLAASGLAYFFGTLPDILEPAHHPNHRQFFHSWAIAGMVGYGIYKAYRWETETTAQKCVRFAGMVIGGTYLVHLAMDATTPMGLPTV